ncbi:MAG: hypothetical protein COU25_01480 [Candidatus Levybacteria bacterium CG10_big_fil_rev_8_21_14_0_10_35_13]|nr:MAG: hypothetical protein COU25_01480 [Candidatus Levybacteria bacterium CG10_big_fil_rev_8_21_14_0_10_35_13]
MEDNLQTIPVKKANEFSQNFNAVLKTAVHKTKTIIVPAFLSILATLKKLLNTLKKNLTNRRSSQNTTNLGYSPRNNFRGKEKKILIVSAIVLVILIGTAFYIGFTRTDSVSLSYSDTRPEAAVAKARQELNKTSNFPITDENGKKAGEIKYTILTAELQDSIIVKGQRAQAVKGRTFLILNLKIVNDNSQGIEINTKDYVRLSVNKKDEWIASEVHNDPVEVQAISTKYTRIGFPINDTDKDLTLRIGEINGDKQTLSLELKPL